jgi:Lrp/AsnC family transcriptional regulator, leucine-responsive regulatory protein
MPRLDELDAVNRSIVDELAADPRVTFAELGRRVGLSSPAVAERVARLEEAGVIRYRVDVDPEALGLPLAAWVRVRPAARQLPKIAELARALPEVVVCDRISGEDCFLMKLHVASMGHLEELLDRFLAFGQTTSSFVVASPVPPRPLPATADPRRR